MKKALFIAFLLCPGFAFGQMQIVNGGNAYGCVAGTSAGATLSVQANGANFNTTGADLLIVVYNASSGATVTVSDSGSNSYTALTARTDTTSAGTQKVSWTKPTTTGANFTFSATGTSSFPALCAIALVGSFTGGSPVLSDNGNIFTTTTTTLNLASSVSTTQSAAFILTAEGNNSGSATISSGPVGYQPPIVQNPVGGNSFGLGMAWRFGSGIVNENPAWNFSISVTGTISATIFQSANSTASPLTTQILSMGVGK